MNPTLQLGIVITLIKTWQVYLIVLNLIDVKRMNQPPQNIRMTPEEMKRLKMDTFDENLMEIVGVATNYGMMMFRLWPGWFSLVWQVTQEISNNDFYQGVAFHIVDKFLLDAIRLFVVVCTGGICNVSSHSVIKQTYSIVRSTLQGVIFVGTACAIFMLFPESITSDSWVKLTLICGFLLICVIEPMQTFIRRATRPSIVNDEHFFGGLVNLSYLTGFDPYYISINYDDDKVPHASYYSAIGCQGIELNEALIIILNNERQTLCMIAREIYFWRRYFNLFDSMVFAGKVMALCTCIKYSYGSPVVNETFGFKFTPHPILPMLLAISVVWPLCTDALNWLSKLCYSRSDYPADVYAARMVDKNSMIQALALLAGRSVKYPVFNPWYSAWYNGHSNVFQRIQNVKNL